MDPIGVYHTSQNTSPPTTKYSLTNIVLKLEIGAAIKLGVSYRGTKKSYDEIIFSEFETSFLFVNFYDLKTRI